MASECLAVRARRMNRLITRIYDDALRPFGLTIAQGNLLVAIGNLGPTTAAVIGRRLDLEKSTVSRNLKLLADKGWITRGRDIELTAGGRKLIERTFPVWEAAQDEVKARLGAGALAALDSMSSDLRP
jgi:DNA-binding MarR family transcriptional regulator